MDKSDNSYMIKNLPDECAETIHHIMDEEKEHAVELIELLKKFK